ncbi:F-box domain-containing protein [Madurella fahalii]|uniref:F-box domain-containing protein n=1 Tax=Madurella fahalii TaxID=1157608 RepID=A0ABQ0GA98_9PEZI
MGQLFSRTLGASPTPPLLQLPVEVLLSITNQLSSSPESIVALSLTCKPLFIALERDVADIRGKYRHSVLALLEKDLGDRFFYCSTCCQLHRFSPWWNPTTTEHTAYCNTKYNRFYCHTRQLFNPNPANSPYKLYYVHARLVMNRHLYGAPKGLSLESLAKPTRARSWAGGPLWLQCPSARIIGDELFLRVTHTLEGTAATLRDAIDEGRYCICMHVATDPVDFVRRSRDGLYRIPELETPEGEKQGSGPSWSPFRVCREAPGFCTICLTDYTTTVERAEVREVVQSMIAKNGIHFGPFVNGWRVTISTYHQLGRCRDTEDWRWVALVGGKVGQPGGDTSPGSLACPGRDMALYPPGVVRQKWRAEDHRPKESSEGVVPLDYGLEDNL